ncbi:cobalamin-dependent protein [bacterium]|nr:cobalamin-dependent protein [bacterium]
MNTNHPTHPLGAKARVLLSSVFGPFAQDDDYGSRKINPMELYQNQVTRTQGGFSLRMFVRSFGLKLIQTNIDAPCMLLDFPDLDRFIQTIRDNPYDIIGISGIAPNLGKVRKMCELIRSHQPDATIVVGGHIANKVDIEKSIDADHIVKGDGVAWFRNFLKQDSAEPVKHPKMLSGFGTRILGLPVADKAKNTAAILIPSVGCPLGCNFCSTSAFFGGKGNFVNYYKTGQELFDVMCDIEKTLKVNSFFVMDENFLLNRKRALELLELMQTNGKSWVLSIFSSARVLKTYAMDQLAGLGVAWVWIGLEGEESQYGKLKGIDTRKLVGELQATGIRVLGSSIIGMENHTPANIHGVIDYAVSHDTVFHQFMLYTPVSGTPLYAQMQQEGKLLSEEVFSVADSHGQYRFNYKHTHFLNGEEEHAIIDAFDRDFQVNGPSVARLIRVLLNGWETYRHHPEKRIRKRIAWEIKPLRTNYAAAVWAMKQWYASDEKIYPKMDALLSDLYRTFGLRTRLFSQIVGRFILGRLKKEEERLAAGWVYEPATFFEPNEAAIALRQMESSRVKKQAENPQLATFFNPALR